MYKEDNMALKDKFLGKGKKAKDATKSALSKMKGAFSKTKETLPDGEKVEWESPARTSARQAGKWTKEKAKAAPGAIWRGAKAAPGAARGAWQAGGRAKEWLGRRAPGAKSAAKKIVAVFIIFILIIVGGFFLVFTPQGSQLVAEGGIGFSDFIDEGGIWWNTQIACATNAPECKQEATIIEGTEDAGIEIVDLKSDSSYFNEDEEIIVAGEIEYTPWKSDWAIDSPKAEEIYVTMLAEDDMLSDEWECDSPETLAIPEFDCVHPPFELKDLIAPQESLTVTVYAKYNFTSIGEHKLFVMQSEEAYRKDDAIGDLGYTEKKTVMSVGGPAEFTIGPNIEWNSIIKLPRNTQKAVDIKIANAELGTLYVNKISVWIPTYMITKDKLVFDCTDGVQKVDEDFTYCTKTMSKRVGKGDSTIYKVKFDIPDNFIEKGVREIPVAGEVNYQYSTHDKEIVQLASSKELELEDVTEGLKQKVGL